MTGHLAGCLIALKADPKRSEALRSKQMLGGSASWCKNTERVRPSTHTIGVGTKPVAKPRATDHTYPQELNMSETTNSHGIGNALVPAALFVGAALVISTLIATKAFVKVKGYGQTISVTGSASKPIRSNRALWDGTRRWGVMPRIRGPEVL